MGVSSGAVANKTETFSCTDKSMHCLRLFPRKQDVPVIPCVVVEIPVYESTEDLQQINTGSSLTAYGCCFCPNDDCLVATVAVMKQQILSVHDLRHQFFNHSLPTGGFVTLWNINKVTQDDKEHPQITSDDDFEYLYEDSSPTFFTYSPKPCCTFTEDGNTLTVILNSGKESLMMARRVFDENESLDDSSDIWFSEANLSCHGQGGTTLCGKTLCAVFTGNRMVTVSKVSLSSYRDRDINEICMWEVINTSKLRSTWKTSSQVLCKDFHGLVNRCRFSPSSSILGLSSTNGDILFLNSQTGSLYTSINHSKNTNSSRSPSDFDFDPLQENVVAIVWQNGCLLISQLDQDSMETVFCCPSSNERPFSNSLKYSPDGNLLAVGTLTGYVLLFDSEYGNCNLILDVCQELMLPDVPNMDDHAVFDISFTQSCQELAVAYNDGVVRIWQLPRVMHLQHICRLAILKQTPRCRINELLLPTNLREYLLYRK